MTVFEIDDADEALDRCRTWAPDVALIHVECCGDDRRRHQVRPVAYGTAIIMIERPGAVPRGAVEGMRRRHAGLPDRAGGRR